jgi:hypothetical protein
MRLHLHFIADQATVVARRPALEEAAFAWNDAAVGLKATLSLNSTIVQIGAYTLFNGHYNKKL